MHNGFVGDPGKAGLKHGEAIEQFGGGGGQFRLLRRWRRRILNPHAGGLFRLFGHLKIVEQRLISVGQGLLAIRPNDQQQKENN